MLAAVTESLLGVEFATWVQASQPYSLLCVVVCADTSVIRLLSTDLCTTVHFALKAVILCFLGLLMALRGGIVRFDARKGKLSPWKSSSGLLEWSFRLFFGRSGGLSLGAKV